MSSTRLGSDRYQVYKSLICLRRDGALRVDPQLDVEQLLCGRQIDRVQADDKVAGLPLREWVPDLGADHLHALLIGHASNFPWLLDNN